MKFRDKVPEVAEKMRPWARTLVIGPPPGEEARIGSLAASVDDQTEFGRAFRFYLELEEGDVQKILRDGVIEVSLMAPQMVPVSVQIVGGDE